MNEELKKSQELIDFIYESPTAFHVVHNLKKLLSNYGFIELKEEDSWNLKKGGKYFVQKNNSALTAFVVGKGELEKDGFKIIGAHTDSPGFKIKPNADIEVEGEYVKLNTEVYGGPIINTWLDRPLSLAGRVTIKSKNPFYPEERLLNIKKPILIIPNLAIHMNRNINSGIELNRQKDILPLLSMVNEKFEKEKYLIRVISQELGVKEEDILDFDLFLYDTEKGCVMGLNDEFISSARLDDLIMVHSGIKALVNTEVGDSTNIMVCFDNEEVGSTTKQGADSPMLSIILERIALSLLKSKEDYYRALAKSFIISCDLGHALHPNYAEKSDPANRPIINKGPIIKSSASQSYTSDAVSSAVYKNICSKAEVPVQVFVNRSDEKGGSTIGPISSSHVNINSVDMGLAILSMHSVRELAGVKDYIYATKSFEEFYTL
ncbi:aminopeptidase [Clostridium carboxidivorans P7]|uniref:M18 family aminopeptidase n=1 Tax=Clostridium carboxidivorans P7 TaxID=536227 RepID=C6PNR3_9CLOT|nr:M18 family aminopeptidase [Clostridium carboxidivorans]AKN32808.1 aminopeptidase [Clostridium carboxidivorans P7]EET89190.1 Aspartyl aminopeptidase [Clostridium carboxidivorans P7]EFG89949.1 aminopeptidase I zinc metalloprotease (M18) [Clostridium carboxidivorans P7]